MIVRWKFYFNFKFILSAKERKYYMKISRESASLVGEEFQTYVTYYVSKYTLLTLCFNIHKRKHSPIQSVSLSYWVTQSVEQEITYLSSYVTPYPVETLGQLDILHATAFTCRHPPSLKPLCNPHRAHTKLTPEYTPSKIEYNSTLDVRYNLCCGNAFSLNGI